MVQNIDLQVKVAVDAAAKAIDAGQNVIIQTNQAGVGLLYSLEQRLADDRTQHATYRMMGATPMEMIDGFPYLAKGGEIAYAPPVFRTGFETDTVLILEEANAAHPRVGEFVRTQAARGGLILIFRDDVETECFADFPAVRVDIRA